MLSGWAILVWWDCSIRLSTSINHMVRIRMYLISVYQMGMCQSILYHMTGGMNVDNHQLLGYKIKFLLLMVMFPSICHCRRVPVFLLPRCYEYNEWFLAAKNYPDDPDFSSNWNPKIRLQVGSQFLLLQSHFVLFESPFPAMKSQGDSPQQLSNEAIELGTVETLDG